MTDFSLVQQLETRLINAWPSLECQLAHGWILRFAKGYSKRANAATPLIPGVSLSEDLIDHVVRQFDAQKIRPCFRLTSLQADDVDGRLAARGFEEIEPTVGMVAELADLPADEIANAYGGDKSDDSILIEIVSRIRQTKAFATLDLDDEPVAWGLAVAERGYVGLYDIVVKPDLRGLGLSRTIVTELMAWGRAQGAARAYLQVREENEVARALYRSLGFSDAYRYTHRVRPLAAAPAKRPR